ncbi:PAS domain-containing protein [Caldimonas tepidiphila]|uniref:PAS domain-containing protein n=1 Tax=Caldimonas tepidiphila TaxID=2315841 RepID=UPI000E5B0606|nr:PAS domain-containing protein [Caldimonas tepidiphila]
MTEVLSLDSQAAPAFLAGGGEMGARMREHDWSDSPLGAPRDWPSSLRTTVGLMLNSGFPMFVAWGPELAFLYNDAYRDILGAKHPRALGRPFREIWAEIWADIAPLVDAALAGEASFRENLPLTMRRRGYDEATWFTFSYSPVHDEDGVVRGLFCACTETTAQVLAERRRGAELERLQQLFEQAPGFMCVLRGPNHVFELVNAAYRQLVGHRDFVGRSAREALPEVAEQGFFELLDRVYDSGEPFLGRGAKLEVQREPGGPVEERFVDFIYLPLLGPHGEVSGIFVQGHDVTEQKRAEAALVQLNETLEERIAEALAEREFAQEALRQAQKMEAIGHLTGGIAHDFNNLLQAVQGNLELLRRHPGDAQNVQRWAENGLRNVQRGARLTAQLLAFSRSQQLELRPVLLDELVRGMAELLARTLGAGIEVELQLDCPGVPVVADATQLEMAVLNLAINARDAMPQGGRLVLSSRRCRVDADPQLDTGDYAELGVSDSGSGMPADVLARAFDPFFTTKGVGKGTGLGLSQVYGFARQAGGIARIRSAPGEGSTVSLWLRLASDLPGERSRDAGAAGAAGLNVLVIDDDAEVRHLVSDLLHTLGHRAVAAADGPAGLALIEEEVPDLVLLDFLMPVMNGAEVASAMRRRFPRMPIVLASGHADSAEIRTVLGPGVRMLRKPFGIEELAAAIERVRAETAAG